MYETLKPNTFEKECLTFIIDAKTGDISIAA
jgi:hypothetical protein